ncbi:MAG: HlyD family efflux transporter periplasmic adaptor subunit [Hyphomicrobiaceae bacterium]|nr:HlyD family efflux transporter periplasmic adaptor subunit [Hyphomicrobiaceae bacterium]
MTAEPALARAIPTDTAAIGSMPTGPAPASPPPAAPAVSAPGAASARVVPLPPRLKPAPPQSPPAPSPVATFIDLEEAFRKARGLDTLRTVLVTGGRKLAPYDCALLLEREIPLGLKALSARPVPAWRVKAASGTTSVDRQAPFLQAFEILIASLAGLSEDELGKQQLSHLDADTAGDELAHFAADFPHLFWVPIRHPDGRLLGGLALFRKEPWTDAHKTLLASLAGPFGHAHAALADPRLDPARRLVGLLSHSRFAVSALALAVLVLAFPVRFSVLAPAEVVGARPTQLAAPIDGIIRDILVEPGDQVAKGAPLLRMVDTKPRNDFEIARKNRAVASAKYQRAIQSAVANRREGEEIAVAKADLDVADAELLLAQDLLDRTQVQAPEAGVVVYSARSNWIGKPVTTGERVMDLVDPTQLELRIDLGVSDAMALKTGMAVKLFLDGNPLGPQAAEITRIGYRPVANAEHQMVYRVFAGFTAGQPPRIGARGTARIDGDRVPLGFYLFRRPIAFLRQKLGL